MMENFWEKEVQFAIKKILDVTSQFLDGKIGVIEASREIGTFWNEFGGELGEALTAFAVIESETDYLPMGDVRALWSPEALKSYDFEIAENEAFYQNSATDAATVINKILKDPYFDPNKFRPKIS